MSASRALRVIGRCLGFIAVFLLLFHPPDGRSQWALTDGVSAVEQPSADELARDTPESMVRGLLGAMAAEDYARASRFLQIPGTPPGAASAAGARLARVLENVLDQGGWLSANWQLSGAAEGDTGDGLSPALEVFAHVRTMDGVIELLAERVQGPGMGRIWLVSAQTVAQLPAIARRLEIGLLQRVAPDWLVGGPHLAGVAVGQWAVLVALAFIAYGMALLSTRVLLAGLVRIRWGTRRETIERVLHAAAAPLRIYLAVVLFSVGGVFLGASVVARQQLGYVAEMLGWLAIGWLLWRIVDAFAELGIQSLSHRNRFAALSVVRFFRRAAKFVILAIAVIAALGSLGFDVTAGLAALGIGGIALALGAQKTVENLVGSLTLIADQPVRVGDFCRIGDLQGTVEDIGMRSTRIRTLDRTVVTIPNGELAAQRIENYAGRDRYWFHPRLALRYETTPDQIRYLLVRIREMLYAHPRVNPEPARIRFDGMGVDSLNLDVFAYIESPDFDGFLEVQEDLALRIMDIVAESGASFAFPSRTLYMARDDKAPAERVRAAEAEVHEWQRDGTLPLPRFTPERIAQLRGSINYPPRGPPPRAPGDTSAL